MAYTYDQLVEALQTELEIPINDSDENFQRILPRIFEYADNRIYREFDFLATTTSQVAALTANNRNVTLPATVIVLRAMNVITPVAVQPDAGTRIPLERISIEAADAWWPVATTTGIPKYYSIIGTSAQAYTVRLSPTPAVAYNAEFIGVIRPVSVSTTVTTTFLTANYPDLYFAACMVHGSGYQADFGAQAEDPQKAMSWEATYKALAEGVHLEAARQKGEGAQWSAMEPPPVANSPRTGA